METIAHTTQKSLLQGKNSVRINSIKVLLVGNNPLKLSQCCKSLTGHGNKTFTIETAFNSEECLKMAIRFKPSIIILDDSIGFMNLMEIAEKLRRHSGLIYTPIIVIKNSNYHHATLNEGIDAFVMLDRVLRGELPELIEVTIYKRSININNDASVTYSLEQKMSKLLASFFS